MVTIQELVLLMMSQANNHSPFGSTESEESTLHDMLAANGVISLAEVVNEFCCSEGPISMFLRNSPGMERREQNEGINSTDGDRSWVYDICDVIKAVMQSLADWGKAVDESNRDLAKYNGVIATAIAQADLKKVQMQIKTGNETQGTAGALADAVGENAESNQQFESAWGDIGNAASMRRVKIETTLNGTLELCGYLKLLEEIAAVARYLSGKGKEDKGAGIQQMIEDRLNSKAWRESRREAPGRDRDNPPQNPLPLGGPVAHMERVRGQAEPLKAIGDIPVARLCFPKTKTTSRIV